MLCCVPSDRPSGANFHQQSLDETERSSPKEIVPDLEVSSTPPSWQAGGTADATAVAPYPSVVKSAGSLHSRHVPSSPWTVAASE